jgi:hypothetical protein
VGEVPLVGEPEDFPPAHADSAITVTKTKTSQLLFFMATILSEHIIIDFHAPREEAG